MGMGRGLLCGFDQLTVGFGEFGERRVVLVVETELLFHFIRAIRGCFIFAPGVFTNGNIQNTVKGTKKFVRSYEIVFLCFSRSAALPLQSFLCYSPRRGIVEVQRGVRQLTGS